MSLPALSPADIALLFEPNPYTYDSTVSDPSLPPSSFVQAMREQEELFFAAFPEAKKAAEYRELRKTQIRAFLASANASIRAQYGLPPEVPPLNHTHEDHIYDDVPELVPAIPAAHPKARDIPLDDSSLCPRKHFLHRIEQEQVKPEPHVPTPQPHSPHTHHDRHPNKGDHHSESQQIDTDKPTSTISRDCGDRVDRPSKPAPKPSARSRKNSSTPGVKRRVGSLPGKRQRQRQQQQHEHEHELQLDSRKPTLACLFCRGRKIACGAPLPGSIGKTCNQCQRRSLPCEFPAESRRGMRKRRGSDETPGESILSP